MPTQVAGKGVVFEGEVELGFDWFIVNLFRDTAFVNFVIYTSMHSPSSDPWSKVHPL